MSDVSSTSKQVVDAASFMAIAFAWAGWLTPLAAAFAILWYCIQIHDRYRYGPRKTNPE